MLRDITCIHHKLLGKCKNNEPFVRCADAAVLHGRVEMIEMVFYTIVLLLCIGGFAMGMTSIARQLLD